MKRFFAMLILLVVVGCTAHADEILFRGIPWGVSYPKMHELIKADVVGEFETEASEPSEIEYIDTGRTENDCGFNSGLWFAEGIDVAGYPLYNIWIVSRYGITDGIVSDSPEDSYCISVEYELERLDDNEAAYKDLHNKLTYLYGECECEEHAIKDGRRNEHCIWRGDNETAVELVFNASVGDEGFKHGKMYMRYFKTDQDEIIAKIDKIIDTQNLVNEYKDSDMAGL